ncbi:hypothetical protein [Porphyrobacter sp. GA68]|uniref:hypothetical protein n=1 Tax=Porphyrobacter sp. GA68 TaxID=2883480 RepID=UPI001D1961CE|nr:hypothetical protein [Porphyrobacter sp. GA68]
MTKEKRNGPLGMSGHGDDDDDSSNVENHSALQNQSDVSPSNYPAEQRRDQNLVTPPKKR